MISESVGGLLLRLGRTFLLCLLVLSTEPRMASAQGKDEGAYKDLIEQALNEFKLKNWPEARVLFRRAHDINPNARTLRSIGVVSFEMRDYPQAVQHLSAALGDTRTPLTDAQRTECENLLQRARTFVGSYTLQITPATAQLTLDGGTLLRDHQGLALVPFGDHTLRASAEKFQDSTIRIQVQGGERGELTLNLAAVGETPAPVAVIGSPAPAPEPVAAPAPAPTVLTPATEPASSERRFRGGGLRYSYVALGTGVLFGGAAVAFWYVGQSKLDDLSASCDKRAADGDPCRRGDTDTGSVQTYERLTNASLGMAAIAAVATGVLVALEWPRERLAVNVGLQSVSLRGSF